MEMESLVSGNAIGERSSARRIAASICPVPLRARATSPDCVFRRAAGVSRFGLLIMARPRAVLLARLCGYGAEPCQHLSGCQDLQMLQGGQRLVSASSYATASDPTMPPWRRNAKTAAGLLTVNGGPAHPPRPLAGRSHLGRSAPVVLRTAPATRDATGCPPAPRRPAANTSTGTGRGASSPDMAMSRRPCAVCPPSRHGSSFRDRLPRQAASDAGVPEGWQHKPIRSAAGNLPVYRLASRLAQRYRNSVAVSHLRPSSQLAWHRWCLAEASLTR
jgi:hypothetical protein